MPYMLSECRINFFTIPEQKNKFLVLYISNVNNTNPELFNYLSKE